MKYNLGLDIGTNSIGWAVVDENNQIVKKGNQALWGVRMFSSAEDASKRRQFRNSRRILIRRAERIQLLQNEFFDEITSIDKNFFQRLNDSFFKIEDKTFQNHYTFFNDNYTDKDYFKKYPTVYHLRKELLYLNQKIDIRMLYLAIHHIIKYRGHFLDDNNVNTTIDKDKIIDIIDSFNVTLSELSQNFPDNEEYFETIDSSKPNFSDQLIEIMKEQNSLKDKKARLLEFFNVEKNSFVNQYFIILLVDKKVNIASLNIIKNKKYDKTEIDISKENFEESIENAKNVISELSIGLDTAINIKQLVDYIYLKKILTGHNYLSESMVDIYEKHNNDLKELKLFVKKYLPNKYYECFRKVDNKIFNYPSYIGMNSTNQNMQRFQHCKKSEFYSYLKKEILDKVTDPNALEFKDKFVRLMENDNFLNRLNSSSNASIPMQLNLKELIKILENQAHYYPFLTSKDENGLSTIDRIIAIFKFKIPFYVGPLNTSSKYSWVERTDEKIKPWNFEKVVDLEKTAKKFIERMQNKCTYLKGINDYCLPKNSLLFSEYNCLQYLNKLVINGSLIDKSLKDDIFKNVFLKHKKPNKKNLLDFLKTNYGYDESSLKSKIDEITCNMASYIEFKEIFGKEFESKIEMIEEIIKDITIFEDKKLLEKRLKEIYNLSDSKVKKIKGLNYNGYATLSKHLLAEFIVYDKNTGEKYGPIIEIMRETNLNLQQILVKYDFITAIDEYNKEFLNVNNQTVQEFIDDNIYVSPIMKRSLLQTYHIIEELERILGTPINKYYIECAREHKPNIGETSSRYKQLTDLYLNSINIASELNANYIDVNKLKKELDDNKDRLRSDKLFLYFIQFGKCMYTLQNIDINDIISGTGKYDIDHIYPQSLIKDDSLDNRVLTLKTKNEEKSDKFIFEIHNFLANNIEQFYQKLLSCKMISKTKYNRLTQKEMSKDELDMFVNRQLVATNQSVKGIINVLKLYKGVEANNIIYSKAVNISNFRQKHNLYKSRTANNYHHAHDAYLNVVIGKALDEYYKAHHFLTQNDLIQMKNEHLSINPETILGKTRIINGRIIWNYEENLKLIKQNLYNRFDITETTKTYVSNEMFKQTTILPANSSANLIPMKSTDNRKNIFKYGGIKQPSYSKYFIVKLETKKGEILYKLLPIPRTDINNPKKYLDNLLLKDFVKYEVINNNIKINVVVEYEKTKFAISGVSSSMYLIQNLKDRNFSYNAIRIIKNIDKYINYKKYNILMNESPKRIEISPTISQKEGISITYDDCINLFNEIKNNYKKDIYNYSIIRKISEVLEKCDVQQFSIGCLIDLISQLLILLKTNERRTANLTFIGLKEKSGTITMSPTLKPGTKFISESITGHYKKLIFEVPSDVI